MIYAALFESITFTMDGHKMDIYSPYRSNKLHSTA